MTHNYNYSLATGSADRSRLEILHRLYGPGSQYFLLRQGLKPGMTVLEIGCGMGDMACWLAQQVAPTGKVIAIDTAEDSLQIAREKATKKDITNVQFLNLDVHEVESLGQQFDFTYGRWVLIFSSNPRILVKKIYDVINPGGIFTHETLNIGELGLFSYPEQSIVAQYANLIKEFSTSEGRDLAFSYHLYDEFKSLGLSNINLHINQPILVTAEDKSVFRLPMETMSAERMLRFMTPSEHKKLIADLKQLEISDAYVGFFRNTITAGIKL